MAVRRGGKRGARRRKKSSIVLSEETVGTNLSVEDHKTFMGYVTGGEGKKADVLRALVHEAILNRELVSNGHREAEGKIKKLHREAVESGTEGLSAKLDELLEIGRRLGSNFEKLLAGGDLNFGLLFELLILAEGISSMVTNDVTKPRLLTKAKQPDAVEETLREIAARFEERAAEKVNKVRAAVRERSLDARSAA